MFCTNCGAFMDNDHSICLQCGIRQFTANKFCHNCGKKITSLQSTCVNCGVEINNLKQKIYFNGLIPPKVNLMSAFIYIVASLLIPGLGQILLGQVKKGFLILIVSAIFVAITFRVYPGAMNIIFAIDTYFIYKKQQRGLAVREWEFF